MAWIAYGALAVALATLGFTHWIWAIGLRGPVLYGEGAVANAAILARDRLEYATGASWEHVLPLFTAANYPPLYFHLAAIGDPFVTGRGLSIAATLFVAGAIAWRARPAGALVAAALALAWLGSVPVLQWGAALKPDLVALAFTVGAVMALDRPRPRNVLAGALIGVAAMAKPTALVPALAMLVFVGRRDPAAAARALVSGIVAAFAVAFTTHGPEGGALTHVLGWNALPWSPELAAPLVLLALLVLAVPIATIALTRPSTTIVTAYAAGGVGVLLLGGREGATINYFLDLSAAIALALAGRAPLLASSAHYPLAAMAQAALAVLLVSPFGIVPGRPASVGAWGDPVRIDVVARLAGRVLVEDGGLLVAIGRQPIVDDVFLWSRNRAREVAGQLSFPEGQVVIDAVRASTFEAVVSEVDLATLDAVGGYERQRWHPDLVAAILDRYALRPTGGLSDHPLFVYTRR